MQKFEILLNRAFSATTIQRQNGQTIATTEAIVEEVPIFSSQQVPSFQQEYFTYLQQNGVSLVNNLNVKSYLNNPKNQSITVEFVNYLSGTSSSQEFLDILYDDNKLSEYFNEYYRKFYTYSNQGTNDLIADPSINLQETKKKITEQDRLYVKTNSLTNYYLSEFDSTGKLIASPRNFVLLPTDEKNFSGKNESYYVNIFIEQGRKTFFSDDFSEFYKDVCDGVVPYNKYSYTNQFQSQRTFGNFSWLESVQSQFNLSLGPSQSSVDNLRQLMPVNFLNRNVSNQDISAEGSPVMNESDTLQSSIFQDSYGYIALPVPSFSGVTGILSFSNFTDFANYTGFYYESWSPDRSSFADDSNASQKYIYQQLVSYVDVYNQNLALLVVAGQGKGSGPSNPPKPISCRFEKVPDPYNQNYLGQRFNPLITDTYRIRVLNTLGTEESVKIKWEPCSVGTLGPDDGFNYISFDINGNVDPTVTTIDLFFSPTDQFFDVYLNIYKNWPVRTPMVFSLRKYDRPNMILEFLVIYLEEFFPLETYNFSEKIDVTSYDVCNLLYNSFVYRNFNDNFLEFQRPDSINVNFVNSTGITLQQSFDQVLMSMVPAINSKLLSLFSNVQIDIYSIARIIGVPVSGIYNIYVWGSYLFGTQDEYSDIDLIIVADSPTPVRQVKIEGIDIAVYTPQRFQMELEEVVVEMYNQTNSSDRVFTVYNLSNQDFKILERISFYAENSKAEIKRKALQFKTERWAAVEEAFFNGNLEAWQKRLWSIFRNLVFSTQVVRDGQITDVNAANTYLDEIKSKSFNNYLSLVQYFNPKIENLYGTLISL